MKIKKKHKFHFGKKHPGTTAEPGDIPGTVKIWHTQGIKQSKNYQTTDCSYGMQITVADDDVSIEDGIVRCEEMVEKYLSAKYKEQEALLEKIS